MSSNVLLPQAFPHVHEWYFYSPKWSDQNLRFILYFSLLYIPSFSTFYTPYVQLTLSLSLLTTPTTPTLVQATIISCLEDNNNLLNCLLLPSFSPPFSPQRSQSDLLKITLDLVPPLLKALQELLIILGIKSKALTWIKALHTLVFIDLSSLFSTTHLLNHSTPTMLFSCYFSNTLGFLLGPFPLLFPLPRILFPYTF